MSKNIVKSFIVLVVVGSCAAWSRAQEETQAPKTPASKVVQDQDTKAKVLERRRAAQASNAAKAKAKAQERQKAAKARAEAEARALDLNRASKAELKKLPGITDAYADAIIAKRPFKTKAELVTWKVLPMEVYQAIHDQVAAKYVPTK